MDLITNTLGLQTTFIVSTISTLIFFLGYLFITSLINDLMFDYYNTIISINSIYITDMAFRTNCLRKIMLRTLFPKKAINVEEYDDTQLDNILETTNYYIRKSFMRRFLLFNTLKFLALVLNILSLLLFLYCLYVAKMNLYF